MERAISQHDAAWKILNDMLGDLTSKGVQVPTSVNKDLRHARFLLMVIKAYPEEEAQRIEGVQREFEITLERAKNTLFELVKDNFGPKSHDNWSKRFNEAFVGELLVPTTGRKEQLALRMPQRRRGIEHVRITLNGAVSAKWVQDIAKYCGVTIDFEQDNVLRITGRKEAVRKALDEVAKIYSSYKL